MRCSASQRLRVEMSRISEQNEKYERVEDQQTPGIRRHFTVLQ